MEKQITYFVYYCGLKNMYIKQIEKCVCILKCFPNRPGKLIWYLTQRRLDLLEFESLLFFSKYVTSNEHNS